MATILIVDDEERIREVVKEYCLMEKYDVIEASDGLEALEMVKNNDIDLIVLDVMMPKLDGLSAFSKIKEIKKIPTIILSARSEEYDKLIGFDLGIDDYVTKPFSPKELVARVKAILKRNSTNTYTYKFEGLIINDLAHEVRVDNVKINLTPKEYELLVYLVKNRGIALTREKILETVWGYDFFGDDRTLDTHVKLLRKNLGDYSKYIVTLRGVGYRFEKDD